MILICFMLSWPFLSLIQPGSFPPSAPIFLSLSCKHAFMFYFCRYLCHPLSLSLSLSLSPLFSFSGSEIAEQKKLSGSVGALQDALSKEKEVVSLKV